MTTPLTVLMTAHDREALIAPAIESVLAQTYADFRMVIVDDGSTDGTRDVAESYARLDRRVTVAVNDRRLGDYPNRNRAARLVDTEYFKFHDSDDVMYPHCLESMIRPLSAAPEAGFAASGHRAWSGGPCPMLLTPALCYEREFLGTGLFMLGPAGMLFRTAAFRQVGGFPEVGAHSDLAFWLKACRTLSVLLVPTDLYWYREHEGQHAASPAARFDAADAAAQVWRALFDSGCPLTGDRLVRARKNAAFISGRRVWRLLVSGEWRALGYHVWACGLTATDWLRYFRPPHRTNTAGTPDLDTMHVPTR
jgi:glycosyltransferase involved in cell wall biosynthesis